MMVTVSSKKNGMTWSAIGELPTKMSPVWKTTLPGAERVALPSVSVMVSLEGLNVMVGMALEVTMIVSARTGEARQRSVPRTVQSGFKFTRVPFAVRESSAMRVGLPYRTLLKGISAGWGET